jgi:hypothetical protein
MPYFVYYDRGSCNDGDHKSGLKRFATLEEAQTFAAEYVDLMRFDTAAKAREFARAHPESEDVTRILWGKEVSP